MAYKGPNLVEWEGNVSILEKSFETIFPCLFNKIHAAFNPIRDGVQ